MNDVRPRPGIAAWAIVLGAVGFAAGFLGPIWLNPDANQGPLVGIFITGPGGAIAGLVLGAIFRVMPVGNDVRSKALVTAAAALALGTLYACLPPPEPVALLLDGTVRDCQRPADLVDAAIRDWDKRIAEVTWARPREGWRQEIDGMLRDTTGIVLTIDVQRQNRILRHRKPWNAGRLTAEGWASRPMTQSYFADFAGDDCDAYRNGSAVLSMRYGQGSNLWPPADLPNFLGLAKVEPAPPDYSAMAGGAPR